MAKVKVKKQSTFIDMTAMSDVTVLLLTFFMLTSSFLQKEPITVNTPASVSEFKVPDTNILTILVDKDGKIFLDMDKKEDLIQTVVKVGEDYGITFTSTQLESLRKISSFGVPIRGLASFLDLKGSDQDAYMQEQLKDPANKRVGIPNADEEVRDSKGLVSNGNEFKLWIKHAKEINRDLSLAIKSDQQTNYPVVKKVMDDLRDMRENRYLLVTNLKTASSE